MSILVFAQFSDCHLYADKEAIHYGHNVYQNLLAVLKDIETNDDIQFAVFTGDLSQDHSDESYVNFVAAIDESEISKPVYWLPGNHDSVEQMTKLLNHRNIYADKSLEFEELECLFLSSKSETPAGRVSAEELTRIENADTQKSTLIFMHHHPRPVGYFIDRHGLQEADSFWHVVNQKSNILAIACGHVHRAMSIEKDTLNKAPLYTCPATSIQFDPEFDGVKALPSGPAYRQFSFENKQLKTRVKQLPLAPLSVG
ncbi:metallophosphoesterase [Thalassotalea sp. PS06]|uniref:metallophosphoesterase n=1 Tax=Thalassotalea sp. PS06 TaxID=2594005 RepID=UPI00163D782B|nr:metallophosphoesterase [Thalassotalea sp. PS06]